MGRQSVLRKEYDNLQDVEKMLDQYHKFYDEKRKESTVSTTLDTFSFFFFILQRNKTSCVTQLRVS